MFFLGLWAILALHHTIPHTHLSHEYLHAFQNSHHHNHDGHHVHHETYNDHEEQGFTSTDEAYSFHTHEYLQPEQRRLIKQNKVVKSWLLVVYNPFRCSLLAGDQVLRPPPKAKFTYSPHYLKLLTKRGPPYLV